MKKVTTIYDISARAGVSITTVSRFLNGNYSNMSEKTRKRLEQIVQELDYHPNSLARSLKSQNSGMVGCVMADMGNPFSALLIKGIQMICRSNGYKLMTLDADNDSLLEKEAYKILLDTPVEGIICNTTGNAAQEIESVSEKTPLVLADRVFPSKKEFDCVVSDNENATYECLRYLRNQGYERIAFFSPPVDAISTRRERMEAFCKGAADFFNADNGSNVYMVDPNSMEETAQMLLDFIRRSPSSPAVLFSVNGEMTLQLIRAAKHYGVAFSRELGICGFDDWPWMEVTEQGITSISTDTVTMGVKCAELLFERIKSKNSAPTCRIVMQNHRTERTTTKRF